MEQAQLKKHVKWSDYTGVILVALVFMLFAFTTDTFLSASNLYSILYGVSIQFFAVIGFTFLIIMGEIDLAVGSTYCLSGIFTGYLYAAKGWPLWLAITVVLSVCGLFGYGVGVLVTRFRLNSMMVTLGSMSFVAGSCGGNVQQLCADNLFPAVPSNCKMEIRRSSLDYNCDVSDCNYTGTVSWAGDDLSENVLYRK